MTLYRVCILVVTGCNQVHGLEQTQLIDAPPPPACSDSNVAFSPRARQFLLQHCTNYVASESLDRAVANCRFDLPALVISEGPRDGALAPAVLEQVPGSILTNVRLAPEGDRAIVEQLRMGVSVFSMYRREVDRWRREYDLPLTVDFDDTVGIPSRSPYARVFHARPNAGVVDELVEDPPGTWRVHATYTPPELGVLSTYHPINLSADGLHLIYSSNTLESSFATFHAVRERIEDRFSQFGLLDGIPKRTSDLFMNGDCSRVYFSGLERVFYVERL